MNTELEWDINRGKIAHRLDEIEAQLWQQGGPTEIWWYGLGVTWKRGTKRDGCLKKRGQSYGKVVYTKALDGRELTREEAISECLKPRGLKQAEYDLHNMKACVLCDATITGSEYDFQKWPSGQRRWGMISQTFEWHYLCPDCIEAIFNHKVLRLG